MSKKSEALYRGKRHYDKDGNALGGIKVVVDKEYVVEVEDMEYKICQEAYNSSEVLQFHNKTNKEILDYIHNEFSCQFKQGEGSSGDFILCRLVVLDPAKHERKGTVRQVLDEMQSEQSCRVSIGQRKMKDGGKVASPAELKRRWDKKKEHISKLAESIRSLRYNLTRDIKSDNEKVKLTALAISVMDKTAERVGNYKSEDNGHLGVTGFSKENVKVDGNTVYLNYTGKSGVDHDKQFSDELIASAIKQAIRNSPSEYIFCTSDGTRISPDRINVYLSKFGISAKDIRGYNANKWIVEKLKKIDHDDIGDTEAKRKKKFNKVLKYAAMRVGHGASTLRTHYMMPELEEQFIGHGKIIDLADFYRGGGKLEDGKSINTTKHNTVGCFIYHPAYGYLILKRGTMGEDTDKMWHILSGGVDEGEELTESVCREIQEEIDYTGDMDIVFIESKEFDDYDFHYFFVTLKSPVDVVLDHENIDYEWVADIDGILNYDLIPKLAEYIKEKKHSIGLYKAGGELSKDKKNVYGEWKKLVNMSAAELEKFYNSKEGKEAGLSAHEAIELGIHYGRQSAKWIIKMKRLPAAMWTEEMWDWAKRQIAFIKRMSGVHGKLYDSGGRKSRKYLSLLIWGHDPAKMKEGGMVGSNEFMCCNAINVIYFEYVPIEELLPFREFDREVDTKWGDPEDLNKLTQEIKVNGITEPVQIEVYKDKALIVEGNHRIAAAKRLGIKWIPTYIKKRNTDFGGIGRKRAKKMSSYIYKNSNMNYEQLAQDAGVPLRHVERSPMAYGFKSILKGEAEKMSYGGSAGVAINEKLQHVLSMLNTKNSMPETKEKTLQGSPVLFDYTAIPNNQYRFVASLYVNMENEEKYNKLSLERLAFDFGITDKNTVKELAELTICLMARDITMREGADVDKYKKLVELYRNQANLSHRTSNSIMLQQYSTPVPIGYVMGLYCGFNKAKSKKAESETKKFFEPSAGNGNLLVAGDPFDFVVNEIDEQRNADLRFQGFHTVLQQDARQPFKGFDKKFDAVITNPPFGSIETVDYDGYGITSLEQHMALIALNTMKDDGKCAIIIGSHTEWDELGRIKAGKNRIFFTLLYRLYNVEDVINIDGHALYSRQGTGFDTRIILINGRKKVAGGYPPFLNRSLGADENDSGRTVMNFDELWKRVIRLV